MSARFYIGQSPGGHALRIMKNADDDPVTTPRTDYDKFAFDSESGNLAYAHRVGSPPSISDLPYPPMVTSMVRYEANWWSIFGGTTWRRRQPSGGDWNAFETVASGRVRRNLTTGAQSIVIAPDGLGDAGGIGTTQYGPYPAILESRAIAWRLPGDSTPNPFPDGSGSIERFYKSGSMVRLPRPGYSVDDANVNNFILHENLSPAKLISSGRMTIPAGGTVDIQVPPEYEDGLVVGGTIAPLGASTVWIPATVVSSSDYRDVQVRFMGGGVLRFREKNGRPTYLAYYIVAEDNLPQSSGTGAFLRSYGSGSNAYVQMCRPGSGEPPRLSDIMLDSRWGTMPIIAEGYVPKSSFSNASARHASISFPDQGYIPLVLVSWVMHNSSDNILETYPGRWARIFVLSTDFPPFQADLGYTSYTAITHSSLTFVHFFGSLPAGIYNTGQIYESGFLNSQFQGVRYWVFAVPQDLT